MQSSSTPSKSSLSSTSTSHTRSKMREAHHWSHSLSDVVILAHTDGSLGLTIKGGADFGEFPYLGELRQDKIRYQDSHGPLLRQGDVILEVQGQKVAGFTQRDVVLWLKHCSRNDNPVVLRCVSSPPRGSPLTKDLKEYLAGGFPKGSLDHELQNAIRDNLYMRTVPCTTRERRPEEINGQDYWFLNKTEFMDLEQNGHLLESGLYGGNYYGTPKPPHTPMDNNSERPIAEMIRPGGFPSSEGKRRRNRSNVEALSPGASVESTENLLTVLANKQPTAASGHGRLYGADADNDNDEEAADNGEPEQHVQPHSTFHAPQRKEDGGLWGSIASQAVAKARHHDSGHHSEDEQGGRMHDDLPQGWERVDDAHYGTYYIDHVNKRTQFEHPNPASSRSQEAPPVHNGHGTYSSSTFPRSKKRVSNSPEHVVKSASSNLPLNGLTQDRHHEQHGHSVTADLLRGEFHDVVLIKSVNGLGFTIIGGEKEHNGRKYPNADNDDDEDLVNNGSVLQIKSIAEGGPAHLDGRVRPGDVLVTINERNVLGYSHDQVIELFRTIQAGQQVRMRICRGYALPADATDPTAQIITTDAITGSLSRGKARGLVSAQQRMTEDNSNDQEVAEVFAEQDARSAASPIYRINIVKAVSGFGFNIAETPDGQAIKKILDKKRCQGLLEGDLLVEINGYSVRGLDHTEVVNVLKDAPIEQPSVFLVQRAQRIEGRKEQRSSRFTGRSKTPTADMYKSHPSVESSQSTTKLKQRSKTPTPRSSSSIFNFFRSKTPKPSRENDEMVTIVSTSSSDMKPRSSETVVSKYRDRERSQTPEKAKSPTTVRDRDNQNAQQAEFKRNQYAYSSMTRMVTPSFIPASQYGSKNTNQEPRHVPPPTTGKQVVTTERTETYVRPDVRSDVRNGDNRPTRLLMNGQGFENTSMVSIPASSLVEGDTESQLHSPPGALDLIVTLKREDAGFGFRIVGGTEEQSQVAVGFIVPNGVAEKDGRLQVGDEILNIDGINVIGAEHRQTIQLMQKSSNNGYVALGVRRRITYVTVDPRPRDIIIRRQVNEGFGFVIISSMTKNPAQAAGGNNGIPNGYPILGRILEDSPAEHCGQLHVGDKIIAVNGHNVKGMHHSEIVQMIKDSGTSVTLTILPQTVGIADDASTISANSQQRHEDLGHVEPDAAYVPYAVQPGTTTTARVEYYSIQLERGPRGFGFSIRGGKEFSSMPLFVLRIAENGPAANDGRLRVADEIMEINGVSTNDFTHSEAIELIRQGGQDVRLLIKRTANSGPMLNMPTSPQPPPSAQPQVNNNQYTSNNNGGSNYATYASPSSLSYFAGQSHTSPSTHSFPPAQYVQSGNQPSTNLHSTSQVFHGHNNSQSPVRTYYQSYE